MPRNYHWIFAAGCLLPWAAGAGLAASRSEGSPPAPPPGSHSARTLKPRQPIAVGDRWRVRVSEYQMQLPEPTWTPPETWLFTAYAVERTEEGPRLLVTATREGASKPSVFLQIKPETRAVTRADVMMPVPGGERPFTERPAAGEPFVSELSPVPIALPGQDTRLLAAQEADGVTPPKTTGDDAEKTAAAAKDPLTPDSPAPAAGAGLPPGGFSFGARYHARTEPVDASMGRAKIQSGLNPLNLRQDAGPGPFGVPRFQTVIEGPGRRVEEIWDDATPWPLYTQTDTSRSWLVAYTKGKSS